jgi:hypothetical protein
MTETTTLPIAIPEDVITYCKSRSLLNDLYSAFRIAEEAYAPAQNWAIGIEPDPDVDDEYVVIDVTTTGDVDELVRKQDAFATNWSRIATPEATWRIRVLWNVA